TVARATEAPSSRRTSKSGRLAAVPERRQPSGNVRRTVPVRLPSWWGPRRACILTFTNDCALKKRRPNRERLLAVSDTPLMQQYREVKQRHPNALVVFRVGDFFELFEGDAEVACAVLGLAKTSRDKAVPMAGFPHHALDPHVRKLV